MANVCSFEMRIRGTKENCEKMIDSDMPSCYEFYRVEEQGTDNDYMVYLAGECRWSVTGSMVDTDEDNTLKAKAEKFNIEMEVFGYDISEPEWVEHYHYKGAEVIKEFALPTVVMGWNMDEMDISDEDKTKYEYKEEHDVYILKEEFNEKFECYEAEEIMILSYDMSFDDLKK